ncbi:MAG: hypothetical protein A2831_01105 [Candidatus Yanofskybacteria bacterium RIFCSPHIGHO2_01_FULL_44_17]|uniref:Uncharacterized protein n=1 Tax=Candidatus Yanofskybacteria bacterium RIFCSPHIGHO2_01_FULL_44_17 TaxID=1802668 RepID=A0A1F8ETV2_9BACT|nr:MAG: hypothetical protein A2831_01105 [Candidatus Yanofskybacteria bacterium RIFCSPHIGHO2_01_FULL_44_17]
MTWLGVTLSTNETNYHPKINNDLEPKVIFIVYGLPRRVLAQAGHPAETKAFCELRRTKRLRVAGQQAAL